MQFRFLTSWLAVGAVVLSFLNVNASDEAPIYRSHFEDNIQELVDWRATLPQEMAKVAVEQSEGEHPVALVIRCEAQEEPLRLAQLAGMFKLEPLRHYQLRVTLRAPQAQIQSGGRARFLVTDARWLWSSASLSITEASQEWQTLVVAFEAPPEPKGIYRVRFEAVKAGLELEVARVEVVPVEGE